MFGNLGDAMAAMQGIDFDKLSSMPDKLDTIIEELRTGNLLLGMFIAAELGRVPSSAQADATDLVNTVHAIANGPDSR